MQGATERAHYVYVDSKRTVLIVASLGLIHLREDDEECACCNETTS